MFIEHTSMPLARYAYHPTPAHSQCRPGAERSRRVTSALPGREGRLRCIYRPDASLSLPHTSLARARAHEAAKATLSAGESVSASARERGMW